MLAIKNPEFVNSYLIHLKHHVGKIGKDCAVSLSVDTLMSTTVPYVAMNLHAPPLPLPKNKACISQHLAKCICNHSCQYVASVFPLA